MWGTVFSDVFIFQSRGRVFGGRPGGLLRLLPLRPGVGVSLRAPPGPPVRVPRRHRVRRTAGHLRVKGSGRRVSIINGAKNQIQKEYKLALQFEVKQIGALKKGVCGKRRGKGFFCLLIPIFLGTQDPFLLFSSCIPPAAQKSQVQVLISRGVPLLFFFLLLCGGGSVSSFVCVHSLPSVHLWRWEVGEEREGRSDFGFGRSLHANIAKKRGGRIGRATLC